MHLLLPFRQIPLSARRRRFLFKSPERGRNVVLQHLFLLSLEPFLASRAADPPRGALQLDQSDCIM